ncbi:MAG TPA: hypothetical protein VMS11_01440 [Solirubrobacterales bacterium]|nr:hypothetical protein [Solirubrobacterales bacterium]
MLAQLIASSLRLPLEPGRTIRSGRVALSTQRLVVSATARGVEPFELG